MYCKLLNTKILTDEKISMDKFDNGFVYTLFM